MLPQEFVPLSVNVYIPALVGIPARFHALNAAVVEDTAVVVAESPIPGGVPVAITAMSLVLLNETKSGSVQSTPTVPDGTSSVANTGALHTGGAASVIGACIRVPERERTTVYAPADAYT